MAVEVDAVFFAGAFFAVDFVAVFFAGAFLAVELDAVEVFFAGAFFAVDFVAVFLAGVAFLAAAAVFFTAGRAAVGVALSTQQESAWAASWHRTRHP